MHISDNDIYFTKSMFNSSVNKCGGSRQRNTLSITSILQNRIKNIVFAQQQLKTKNKRVFHNATDSAKFFTKTSRKSRLIKSKK
jgi:hypothetical protein